MVRPRAKVTIDSLVYEKSIGTNINDLDLYLEVVSRSRQVNHCVTFDVEYLGNRQREAWFQRTTNRKWHMEYQLSNSHV